MSVLEADPFDVRRALSAPSLLRDFNDAVLETGSVPLTALEARIDLWIAQQRRSPPPH